jgi:hypothetical protein
MLSNRIVLHVAALALLPLMQATALGDYISIGGYWHPNGNDRFEAYDGFGPSGGGLEAGQIRLTIDVGAPGPPPFVGDTGGVKDLAFITTLKLTPQQFTLPPGYTVEIDGPDQWGISEVNLWNTSEAALSAHFSTVISGVGTAATSPNSFPYDRSGWIGSDWEWAPAPEPSTLMMSVIALGVFPARRAYRLTRKSA